MSKLAAREKDKRYRERHKKDPEWRSRRRQSDNRYRERHKKDPEWKERKKRNYRRWWENKGREKTAEKERKERRRKKYRMFVVVLRGLVKKFPFLIYEIPKELREIMSYSRCPREWIADGSTS